MALYVWGSNATQQLGLDDDQREVLDVRHVEALRGEVLVDFSGGVQHSLAVNQFGQVFAWGRGKEGQLGLGQRDEIRVRHPERVAALDGQTITKVSCGDTHSLALSADGEVFMWGLLPETREVKNDGMFDQASVSLAGLQSSAVEDREASFAGVMARLIRGSEEIYEAQNMTKHDIADAESSLAFLQQKKTQTVRHPCFVPRLSRSLRHHVIVNIAAGFAHSLAVSRDGSVFSCGYNDNGQLGIGSRRNSADFIPVQGLEGYIITQVACGQQHSMACSRVDPLGDPQRSGVCFSWGLGILGQLGLGVNISWLPMAVDISRPVKAIAAGSHHSVAVTTDGKVYTWGHSEYGQHGSGERNRDLQQGLYYFFPRVQEELASEAVIERISCSSHSTFALTVDGHVYSWGWNVFGILGNGKYQHSVHPQRILGLKDNIAIHVAAGSNHCGVIVRPRGCHCSLQYDAVLKNEAFTDIEFVLLGENKRLRAHQVIVTARCGYLRGLLRAMLEHREDQDELLVVDDFADVDPQVFFAFLLFLYTSRVDIAPHKRNALLRLAERVCLDELASECQVIWRKERPNITIPVASQELGQFEQDMQQVVLSSLYADVEFLWPNELENGEEEECKQEKSELFVTIPAHKAVLSQVDYFRTMFAGGFSEAMVVGRDGSRGRHQIVLHHMPQDGISLEAFKALLTWIYTGSVALLHSLGPRAMMDLFVVASLVSLSTLARQCEMLLIDLVTSLKLEDDVDSLTACLDFAERFDARRLHTVCLRALKIERQDGETRE
ncbi:hypothetical protein ATCC90586_005343 [Pythium insidiosum]|nr:hypothetical protein ATCC90586_005343 [Pythium insidiosum]